jgi:hypothetical protein
MSEFLEGTALPNWISRIAASGLVPPRSPRPMVDRMDAPRGWLRIWVRTREGLLVREISGENIVTNGGRAALAHLSAGDDVANRQLASMSFGEGNGTPAVADSTLFGKLFTNNAVTGSPASGATFDGTLANVPVNSYTNSTPAGVAVTVGTQTYTDDGAGNFTGSPSGAGTIVYSTGVIHLTGILAPNQASAVTATYYQTSTIITKATTFSFPAATPPTQVEFDCSVLAGEGNGPGSQNYTEAGLVTGAGVLATHKVFGLVTKTSSLVLTAKWTLIL